jgi:hypothetical protein
MGLARLPSHSRNKSLAERTNFRQDHHVGLRRYAAGYRDAGLRDHAFAIIGIAMEIGIEPTVRHGAELGYIPVVIKDASGFGHRDAAERSLAALEFAGDAFLTTTEAFCDRLGRTMEPTGSLSATALPNRDYL